jgi:type I restriction enzyme S subunit
VQNRFVDLTNAKKTTECFYKLLIEGGRRPQVGDLILSRNATVGEVAQVADWHPPFAMGQDVCILKKLAPALSTDFLQAVFQSAVIARQLADLMVGSTFKRANVDQIRNFTVPIPEPSEQRIIAAALSDADTLLVGLDRLIAKKRDLKQAAMQQLLTGQIRLPGFSGDWRALNMAETSTLKARIGWQGLTTAEYLKSGEYYLVTGTDFVNGRVAWSTCCFVAKQRYAQDRNIQLRPNDILLTKDGTIGKVGFVDHLPGPATLNSGVFVIRPKDEAYDPRYFYYVLTSRVFEEFLTRLQAGSTIRHLYQKDFRFSFLAPPTLAEQTAIAAVLSDMDAEIAALEHRREKTRAVKQAMMQELLTGKTRLVTPEVAHA